MNISKSRWLIIVLSFLTLLIVLLVKNEILSIILLVACMFAALFILYRHMSELTDIAADHPKMKTLKAGVHF